jgi:hypothetical protein
MRSVLLCSVGECVDHGKPMDRALIADLCNTMTVKKIETELNIYFSAGGYGADAGGRRDRTIANADDR